MKTALVPHLSAQRYPIHTQPRPSQPPARRPRGLGMLRMPYSLYAVGRQCAQDSAERSPELPRGAPNVGFTPKTYGSPRGCSRVERRGVCLYGTPEPCVTTPEAQDGIAALATNTDNSSRRSPGNVNAYGINQTPDRKRRSHGKNKRRIYIAAVALTWETCLRFSFRAAGQRRPL